MVQFGWPSLWVNPCWRQTLLNLETQAGMYNTHKKPLLQALKTYKTTKTTLKYQPHYPAKQPSYYFQNEVGLFSFSQSSLSVESASSINCGRASWRTLREQIFTGTNFCYSQFWDFLQEFDFADFSLERNFKKHAKIMTCDSICSDQFATLSRGGHASALNGWSNFQGWCIYVSRSKSVNTLYIFILYYCTLCIRFWYVIGKAGVCCK